MRVIKVDEVKNEERGSSIVWWILAGAVVGTAAGVLIAEQRSGRKSLPRNLWRKAQSVARIATSKWGPALAFALELKDAWKEGRAEAAAEALEEELEELYEETEAYADEFDEDLDEDLDDLEDDDEDDDDDLDDDDEEDLDEDEDEDDEAGTDSEVLASRVLEAFVNDPVLAERDVEIEADDEGTVSLFGRVRTRKEAAHAATIAGGVPGVEEVEDYLRVGRRR